MTVEYAERSYKARARPKLVELCSHSQRSSPYSPKLLLHTTGALARKEAVGTGLYFCRGLQKLGNFIFVSIQLKPPTQDKSIFSSYGLPLKELDFSHNSLRRLPDKLLAGVRGNITKLALADNLLGDNLNPIFSTAELHNLPALEELDLSGNSIRGLEEGLLIGCDVLKVLRLDRNNMNHVPSSSLNGPQALKVLSLRENRIGVRNLRFVGEPEIGKKVIESPVISFTRWQYIIIRKRCFTSASVDPVHSCRTLIRQGSFVSQKTFEEIDLHANMISTIEGGAFIGLGDLQALDLGRNRLSKFNSDVFQGAENLEKLDLSENFITDFPTVAMKSFVALKHLNLSSNMITVSTIQVFTTLFPIVISVMIWKSDTNLVIFEP
uniref:SFRICE_032677 n=1 Tax=Spodoptera frugiperda TaxID=7108 RepID=A0A2H1WGG8_SPOFR